MHANCEKRTFSSIDRGWRIQRSEVKLVLPAIILQRCSAVKVSRLRWPKSNLDRNLPSMASRGRCNSFQAAGTAIRVSKVSGHLSLPLWCQSRHPGRDDDYSHLTPCRADFSIFGAQPTRKLVNPFGARWLTRGCARADAISSTSRGHASKTWIFPPLPGSGGFFEDEKYSMMSLDSSSISID